MRHSSRHSKSNKGTKPAWRYDRGSSSQRFQGQARMFYNFESCLMETFQRDVAILSPLARSVCSSTARRRVCPGIPPPVARQSLCVLWHPSPPSCLVGNFLDYPSLEPIPFLSPRSQQLNTLGSHHPPFRHGYPLLGSWPGSVPREPCG